MTHLALVVNNADFLVSHRMVLVRGALAAGYRVSAIVPDGAGVSELERAGCEVHRWRLRRTGQRVHEEALALAHLTSLYARLRPDLAHHVTVKAMLYGSMAARATRLRAVVNAVSGLGYVFLSEGLRARARREVLRLGYRAAFTTPNSAVVLQNDDDEDTLRQLGVLDGVRVVKIRGSGVDLDVFAPSPEPADGPPLVVVPARLLRDKGVREFAEAARVLKRDGVTARFALVGGEDVGNPAGIPRGEVEAWVNEGTLEWWGHRSDMPNVLRQATVVCLPSYREGMPRSLLEAAAMERAIVTTDVPGCRDAVDRGRAGLLVPARDAVALAAALREVLTNHTRRHALAASALRHARANFSETGVLQQHLALYESLLVK